eukprot:1108164-Prorocentrum_minimum.AAC.2
MSNANTNAVNNLSSSSSSSSSNTLLIVSLVVVIVSLFVAYLVYTRNQTAGGSGEGLTQEELPIEPKYNIFENQDHQNQTSERKISKPDTYDKDLFLDECTQQCDEDPACEGLVFDTGKKNQCWLKRWDGRPFVIKENIHRTSYMKNQYEPQLETGEPPETETETETLDLEPAIGFF